VSTNHLRPAPESLSLTETSATWRNKRGQSFVAERCPLAGEAGYVKGTQPGDWEIYRVAVVDIGDGVLEYETDMAVKDADVISAEELEAIIGRDPELTAAPHAVAVSERATPGLAAAANQAPQPRTSKPAPAPAPVVGKVLKPGGRRP
jgi:hypothetical protein